MSSIKSSTVSSTTTTSAKRGLAKPTTKRRAKSPSSDEDFYETGRGLVAIFSQSGNREGNDADVQTITDTFNEIGSQDQFVVMPFTDFSLETLESEIREVMGCLRRGDFVSFTMFIMAHGFTDGETGEDCVRDATNCRINISKDLIRNLCNSLMPKHFRNRPKLVFVQACRGRQVNLLLPSYSKSKIPALGGPEPMDGNDGPPCKKRRKTKPKNQDLNSLPRDGNGNRPDGRVANIQDHYVLRSTVQDTVSYRMLDGQGSYFVQSICQVLRERPSIELESLRRRVARMMSEHDKGYNGMAGMVPELTNNTLTRRFRYVAIQAQEEWGRLMEVDEI